MGVWPDYCHVYLCTRTERQCRRGENSKELQYIMKHSLYSADQPVLILGDFNLLSEYLPTLQKYVDCPIRLNQTIDLC